MVHNWCSYQYWIALFSYLVGGLEHGFYDFTYIGNDPNWLFFSEDFSDHKNIAGLPWIATQIGADLKISEGFNGDPPWNVENPPWNVENPPWSVENPPWNGKIHHEMWKIHHEMWKIQHQIMVYVLENHQISWKILYQGIGVTPGRVRFG